jgi:hypothetical protein
VGTPEKPIVAATTEVSLSTIKIANIDFGDWDEVCDTYEKEHWKADEVMTQRADFDDKPLEEKKEEILKQLHQAIADWEQKHGKVIDEEERRDLVENWGMCKKMQEKPEKPPKRKVKDEKEPRQGSQKSPKKLKGDEGENVAKSEFATNIDADTVARIHDLTASNLNTQVADLKATVIEQISTIRVLEEDNKRLLVENASLKAKLEAADVLNTERTAMFNRMIEMLQATKK